MAFFIKIPPRSESMIYGRNAACCALGVDFRENPFFNTFNYRTAEHFDPPFHPFVKKPLVRCIPNSQGMAIEQEWIAEIHIRIIPIEKPIEGKEFVHGIGKAVDTLLASQKYPVEKLLESNLVKLILGRKIVIQSPFGKTGAFSNIFHGDAETSALGDRP